MDNTNMQPTQGTTKKKKWLLLVAIIVVGIPVVGYYIYSFKKPTVSKNADVKNVSVGDTVFFGSYEQDGDTSNGTEPIEWIILSKEKGKALLVSKYVLDCQPYNIECVNVTWMTCSLRKWLNSDFLNSAFDESEKTQIPEVKLDNPDNSYYGIKGGISTEDRIFVLSVDEISRYYYFDLWDTDCQFGFSKELITEPTYYAELKGVEVATLTKNLYDYNNIKDIYESDVIGSRGAYWRLRSPSRHSTSACIVDCFGGAGAFACCDVDADYVGVRPALYVAY